jgi:branched-chain amino acid transport system ATP-binding protein
MSTSALLDCERIHGGYGASQVLFGVDFSVRVGEVVGLLGRNGMGKSTTIKHLFGVLTPRQGEIRFNGQRIDRPRTDAIARLGLALVPEGRQCFPNLTVKEHLVAFARARGPWTLERLFELFPRLAERRSHFGNQLSGGEQQMLAIARALSTQPRLLVLDEATEGLAPLVREEIWRCLAQLRSQGQTTLVVDKYVDRLLTLADRHLILERGAVVWQGTSQSLASDRSLWSRYLGV